MYKLDINSPKVKDVFKKHKFDVVYHEAAQIDLRKSVDEVRYLLNDPDSDVFWVCRVTKDRRKPKIEPLNLDDL